MRFKIAHIEASEDVKYLFELSCAARVAYPLAEKAFNRFYFAISESIILRVVDDLVIDARRAADCVPALRGGVEKRGRGG